jgi:purine-cytosine permease-like protein
MQEQNNNTDNFLGIGIDLGLMLAGFFGALILALTAKNQTPGRAITSIFAGALCANYMTPIALHFMPESIQINGKYGAAFIMGFIGLKTLELVYDFVSKKLKTKNGKINIDISM